MVAYAQLKQAIIAVLQEHEQEMEGYSYFGSNRGVPKDEYEEVAEEICKAVNKKE